MRTRIPFICWLVGLVGSWIIRVYYLSVHVHENPRSRRRRTRGQRADGCIYALWHAHQLSSVLHYRNLGVNVLVSSSTDGEMIAEAARRLGFRTVRGSSTRGGTGALLGLMEKLRRGEDVAITPDGPRGPRHRVKHGAIYLAQKTGRPIVPAAIGISSSWELPSWDRFRIPKPLARGYAMFAQPIRVPSNLDDREFLSLRGRLSRALDDLERRADRIAAGAESAHTATPRRADHGRDRAVHPKQD